MSKRYDAVVVGSGPNGLGAAVEFARNGYSTLVIEGSATIGGGTRTAELTLPGFLHDICSAAHPMALATPFFRDLPLDKHGLEWIEPPNALAHPLADGSAAFLSRSIDETARNLGDDERPYHRLVNPLASSADTMFRELVGPLRPSAHPILGLRFAWRGLRSGRGLAEKYFRGEKARALIAGLAAHAVLPLEKKPGGAVALMLGVAGHHVGWPMPKGGAGKVADALASLFRAHGGEIEAGRWITNLNELPESMVVLLDLTPRQVLAVGGDRLPPRYRRALGRYRYGMGCFKVDWALSGPIPWKAEPCRKAGTVHVGGTLDEISVGEQMSSLGLVPEQPFVLVTQPSLFDSTRAPAGKHTAWGYCHVPHGSDVEMTDRIEAQIERFAPGFRDVILARHSMNPSAFEQHNPNYVGGDIGGGMADLWQLFARPVARLNPYATPVPGLYLCSSSTPPGGGVHGLCGHFAARSAIRFLARRRNKIG
jgi:phytoene dehydrogenase-like protein